MQSIVQRGRQLFGRKTPIESYRELGWERYDAHDFYVDDWPDHRQPDEERCPECGKSATAALRHVWENEETDDYWNVYHFWCSRRHMWADAERG